MHSRIKSFLLVSALLGLTSCATVGKPIEFGGPETITVGSTTKNDIYQQYGEPFRVGFDNGNLKWTYGYYKVRMFGDTDTQDLAITFDKKGLVKDYTYSSSVPIEKKKLLQANN